ncbi:MAG: hypothetical protein GXO18_00290 [Aquificae bacterium]|nr:hypothetical protein [Aquificota bacterium]
MRSLFILVMLFFSLNLIISFLLAEKVKQRTSENYILLNKLIFIPVPRDLHYGIANMNFTNTVAYIGYALEKGRGRLNRRDGRRVFESLDAITLYNPRYFDPYYVANAFLTWELGMYNEALHLLERGLSFLKDWRIPFYMGFIYFYFLGDNAKGAKYMALAAKYRKDKRSNLAVLLASRLYYEEGKLLVAIALLKEQINTIKDESIKEALKVRLEALKGALRIYNAIDIYKKRFGKRPQSIDDLVEAGLIPPDMRDPLGGRFYLTEDGKVRSEKVLFPIRKGGK